MVAGAEETEQAGERVEREDVAATQRAPDGRQLVGGRNSLRARGDEGSVERARGRADDQVRADAALVERTEHADLDGTEAGTAGEDERHLRCLRVAGHYLFATREGRILTSAWLDEPSAYRPARGRRPP